MKRFALIATAVLLSACGGDGLGPEDIAGTYRLITVAGESLPALLATDGVTSVELESGTVRLNSDFTFSTTLSIRVFDHNTSLTETDAGVGTFTQNGTALVFTYTDGSIEGGSLNGDRLTIIVEAVALVFERGP